jgi:SAM-dependent methyltransferase/uncharacterized membrane protein YbhN (UPF0104 family)
LKYKKYVTIAFSLLVVYGAFLWLKNQNVSLSHFKELWASLSWGALSFIFVSVSFQLFAQGARLWIVQPPLYRLPWIASFRILVLGQCINAFLPARAGDAYKVVALTKEGEKLGIKLPLATTAGIVLADKTVDVLSFLLLCAFSSPAWLGKIPWQSLGTTGAIAIGVVAFSLFVLFKFFKPLAEKIKNLALSFRTGMSALTQGKLWFLAVIFSFIGCAGELFALKILASSFGYTLSVFQILWVLLLLNLGIAIPLTVANVGAFEASMAYALTSFDVPMATALGIATFHHFFQIGMVVIWTGILLLESFLKSKLPNRAFKVREKDKERALKYYDKISPNYHKTVEKGILNQARVKEREAVLALAELAPHGNWMIDVGCGQGFYALEAKKQGWKVCAVDRSPGMVSKITPEVDEAAVVDVEILSLERKFDRVICAGVMDFVLTPEKVFRNLADLLAPGGKMVILAPRQGLGGFYYRLEKLVFGFKVNLYTPQWFRQMAEKSGLTLTNIRFPLVTNMAMQFERIKT